MFIVLWGCETWYPTSREESWLELFENMVIRKTPGPKRKELTGGYRKLHGERFMTCTPDQIEDKMGEAYSTYGGEKKYKV